MKMRLSHLAEGCASVFGVALAVSGCKAIVEGFYSLVNVHKRMVASQMKCSLSVQLSTGVCHTLLFAQLPWELLPSSILREMITMIC